MESVSFICSCGKTVMVMAQGASISFEPTNKSQPPWDDTQPLPLKVSKLEATIQLPKECTSFTFEQMMEAYNEGIKSKHLEARYKDLQKDIGIWVSRKSAANADGSGHTPDPELSELRKLAEGD